MLVAKGASSDTLNDRSAGIWSAGSGPDAAKLERLRAVITRRESSHLFSVQNIVQQIRTIQNDNFVSRVNVEALIQRECYWIVIQRSIRRRIVGLDGRVCQSGEELLYVSDPLCARDRGAKGGVVPSLQH